MEENTILEIQWTNLSNVVLMLKILGTHDLINFDSMDSPRVETLIRALQQLYALGTLNDKGVLTKLGWWMEKFPLDPMLSKMIVSSDKYKWSKEIITSSAMLSVRGSIFYHPKDKKVHANNARMNFHIGNLGDHIALSKVFKVNKFLIPCIFMHMIF